MMLRPLFSSDIHDLSDYDVSEDLSDYDLSPFMYFDRVQSGTHINDLSDDIISHIISFLSARDAVRTRILSRKWRYLYPNMSHLDFSILTVLGERFGRNDCELPRRFIGILKSKFVKGVSKFLQLHRRKNLDSFKVRIHAGNESAYHIDKWVSFATNMNAEKIHLEFLRNSVARELYTFPCDILSWGKMTRLKHLSLDYCNFKPSLDSIDRLNSLYSLHLTGIRLDETNLGNILSGCLKLESFRLVDCFLPQTVIISKKLVCLKTLVMKHVFQVKNIELYATNLRTFEYSGSMPDFRFIGVSSLENVYLWFICTCEKGTNYMFGGLANDLPRLSTYSLTMSDSQFAEIPLNMTTFSNLKRLELFLLMSNDFDIFKITRILNACPLLEQFYLGLSQIHLMDHRLIQGFPMDQRLIQGLPVDQRLIQGLPMDQRLIQGLPMDQGLIQGFPMDQRRIQELLMDEIQEFPLDQGLIQGFPMDQRRMQELPMDQGLIQGFPMDQRLIRGFPMDQRLIQGFPMDQRLIQGFPMDRRQIQGCPMDQKPIPGCSMDQSQIEGCSMDQKPIPGCSMDQSRIQGCSNRLQCQLKEVEISGFNEDWNVMDFVTYLLQNVDTLKKMIINPQSRTYEGGDYWCSRNYVSWDESDRKRVRDLLVEKKINPMTEIIIS